MDNQNVINELEAIKIYCDAIRRENNRGIIKVLVREEISSRTTKLLNWFRSVDQQGY